MTLWRSLISACVLLTMVLTSAAMAVARAHQPTATGTMVLCTGSGPVSVQMDAEGQPIGPVHFCPDCALGLFDAPANPNTCAVALTGPLFRLGGLSALTVVLQSAQLRPKARAPPIV